MTVMPCGLLRYGTRSNAMVFVNSARQLSPLASCEMDSNCLGGKLFNIGPASNAKTCSWQPPPYRTSSIIESPSMRAPKRSNGSEARERTGASLLADWGIFSGRSSLTRCNEHRKNQGPEQPEPSVSEIHGVPPRHLISIPKGRRA